MGAILFCIALVLFVGFCCWLASERQDSPPWDNHQKWGTGDGGYA